MLDAELEFDPAKDALNRRDHRISLARAVHFDFDAAYFELDDSVDYVEERWNAIGFLDAQLYVLTFTERGPNVRAISLRKANATERSKYVDNQG